MTVEESPTQPDAPVAPAPSLADRRRHRVPGKSLALLTSSLVAVVCLTGSVEPSRPSFKLVGLWPGYLRGDVTCVSPDGRFAYIGMTIAGPAGCKRGWRGCLEVIDVRDPARPVWVSSRNFSDPIRRIQTAGNYLYVASGGTLHVLAVTDASTPILSGRCDVGAEITSFQLKGQCVYAVRGGSLDVINVSNPAQPVVVGGISTGWGDSSDVQVVGN